MQTNLTLPELVESAHNNAITKGFHSDYLMLLVSITNSVLPEKSKLKLMSYCRNTEMCKDLSLVVTEISEAIEHIRNDRRAFDDSWKETLEEEIADAMIRILDFCGMFNINIEKYIMAKMEYNKNREYKHGKEL